MGVIFSNMNELKENEIKMMLIKDKLFDLLHGDNYNEENAKIYYSLMDKLDELGIKSFDINNFKGKEQQIMERILINLDIEILIKEYFKLFPNDGLFPEWFDVPDKDKIEMLQEAIKDKKDISQTKLFGSTYQEMIIRKTTTD